MNHVLLQYNGTLLCDGKVVADSPLPYLNNGIALDSDFTLRSYFRLLNGYSILQQLNDFAPMLMEQYQKSPENGCTYSGLDHLEFNKTVEMIGFPGRPRLEIYTIFQGVGKREPLEIRSIQIESLLDMPVKLGRLKHIIFGDKMDVFEFDTVYTLFEFIDGIAWALSFHGTPTECQIRR